jgi:hypothetical protein
MSIPTLVIILTVLIALYGVIWHDETADGIRNESSNQRENF